jgi:hypothetical protein
MEMAVTSHGMLATNSTLEEIDPEGAGPIPIPRAVAGPERLRAPTSTATPISQIA